MKIETVVVGPLEVNCYIVYDDLKEAIVIDPGADGNRIVRILEVEKLKPKYIINTHGHVDHVGANAIVKEAFPDASIVIHELDVILLENAMNSFIASIVGAKKSPPPDIVVKDGDSITLGSVTLKVIHTPGHTPGSMCLLMGDVLFTGDTLFAGSVGRVDLPYSEPEKLIPSIKNKILPLGDSIMILPGHGPSSTIGAERKYNPFLTGVFLI
ncbi:MAG: MBL fold metallo-hydrolase [candidate division WOR-3 bacterium]